MKAPTFGVDLGLPVILTTEVIALAAAAAMPAAWGWWPPLVVIAACLILLGFTVFRRSPTGWLAAAARLRRHRRHPVTVPAALDIAHGSTVCGVRADTAEAVTMIEVTGRPYAPTILKGSSLTLTPNVLPVALLVEQFTQPGGLKLAGIDIVETGLRVRRGSGYPQLYSTLLADRSAAGQRSTRLIVRLDLAASQSGLVYRASVGYAAAAVTERIVKALLQNTIRARALNAAELDTALAELSANLCDIDTVADLDQTGSDEDSDRVDEHDMPAAPARTPVTRAPAPAARPTVRWRTVHTRPGYLTAYYFSPEDIRPDKLNHMWALRSDHIVLTVSLRQHHDLRLGIRSAPVEIAAMMRCNEPQAPQQAPTLYLNPLPADQRDAMLRSAPVPNPALRLPTRPLADNEHLDIPIGPSGVLLGTTVRHDSMLLMALTDPVQATRIVLDTDITYARALFMRAAAVGERLVIYTDHPPRWTMLTASNIAIVDHERGQTADFVPTIVVNDRGAPAPAAGLASTVISFGHTDTDGPLPDISFTQISHDTIRLHTPTISSTDFRISTFKAEETWTH